MKKKKSQTFSVPSLLLFCVVFLILFPSPAVSKHKKDHNNDSCKGKACSQPVTARTKAFLTLNSFEKGGDGGGPSECDGKFHSDNDLIVALSTRWYENGERCFKHINIFANGKKVKAMVVDECDSKRGCGNNIIDGSKAVWKALGEPTRIGKFPVQWTDA